MGKKSSNIYSFYIILVFQQRGKNILCKEEKTIWIFKGSFFLWNLFLKICKLRKSSILVTNIFIISVILSLNRTLDFSAIFSISFRIKIC